MAPKSSVGWLILAAALAVPGVLFYQWYAHLDRVQKRELNLKVRGRIPDGGPFAASPNKDKLINPIAAEAQETHSQEKASAQKEGAPGSTATAASTAAPAALAPPGPQTALPAAEAAAPLQPAAAASNEPPPAASGKRLSPETEAPPAAPPESSSVPAVNPFLSWRDPTLSPYDKLRLERLEAEKQLKLDELKAAAEGAKRPKAVKEPNFDKIINLQGIVSSPEGANRAIINGEAIREGDRVGPVRVLRITPQGVVFGYKNRRFTKSMNR